MFPLVSLADSQVLECLVAQVRVNENVSRRSASGTWFDYEGENLFCRLVTPVSLESRLNVSGLQRETAPWAAPVIFLFFHSKGLFQGHQDSAQAPRVKVSQLCLPVSLFSSFLSIFGL